MLYAAAEILCWGVIFVQPLMICKSSCKSISVKRTHCSLPGLHLLSCLALKKYSDFFKLYFEHGISGYLVLKQDIDKLVVVVSYLLDSSYA